jgi:hypothetical protein
MHHSSGGVHYPRQIACLLFHQSAVRFERRLAARLGRDGNLHAPPRAFRQEHRLLNHDIRQTVAARAKKFLGGRESLLHVGRCRNDHRALDLVVGKIMRRFCAKLRFE